MAVRLVDATLPTHDYFFLPAQNLAVELEVLFLKFRRKNGGAIVQQMPGEIGLEIVEARIGYRRLQRLDELRHVYVEAVEGDGAPVSRKNIVQSKAGDSAASSVTVIL